VREATIDVNALAAKQQVSDEEINAYYEQNKNPLFRRSSSA
jgi:peptidyl-prolyl cis-trans isomerase D